MTDPSMNDFNNAIIEEFRANRGQLGGQFEGAPMLLLHHSGAKSGRERVSPVMYQALGEDFALFGSKAGAPTNPDWYHNLVANPDASIEVGTETIPVTARVTNNDEREPIWTRQKALYPRFAEYEQKTSRQIPVIILSRR